MTKVLVVGLALVGAVFILNLYAPQLWNQGIPIMGYLLSYAMIILAALGIIGWRLQAK